MMQDGRDVAGDVSLARAQLLRDRNVKVAAAKGGRLIGWAAGDGIRPLLDLAEQLGEEMRGAGIADRVIGRAAAFVLIAAGAAGVHGETLSREAVALLERAGIAVTGEHVVPHILRPDGAGPCVMEQQVRDVEDPAEALARLRRFLGRG